jgi:8-oxo-dGTP pyrophosphatase MutT (NUDIX family)
MIEEMEQPEAAVAILHARAEDSILLMRRADRVGDPWSGHWSLPGGRCEAGDRDPSHTALRELEEECGIQLGLGSLETALPVMAARRRTGPSLVVAPFVFAVDHELPAVVDQREAVGALWMPRRVLTDPAQHCLRTVPGAASELLYPGIAMEGAPLWGFTYRLLTAWLGLISAEEAQKEATLEDVEGILAFLVSHGLPLAHGWTNRSMGSGVTMAATVVGAIPVEEVIAHVCSARPRAPQINALEVRKEFVRVIGLMFEQYLIEAVPA